MKKKPMFGTEDTPGLLGPKGLMWNRTEQEKKDFGMGAIAGMQPSTMAFAANFQRVGQEGLGQEGDAMRMQFEESIVRLKNRYDSGELTMAELEARMSLLADEIDIAGLGQKMIDMAKLLDEGKLLPSEWRDRMPDARTRAKGQIQGVAGMEAGFGVGMQRAGTFDAVDNLEAMEAAGAKFVNDFKILRICEKHPNFATLPVNR